MQDPAEAVDALGIKASHGVLDVSGHVSKLFERIAEAILVL